MLCHARRRGDKPRASLRPSSKDIELANWVGRAPDIPLHANAWKKQHRSVLDTASSIGYFLRELPFSPVSSASSAASICTTELFNLFLNKLDGARSIFIHLE